MVLRKKMYLIIIVLASLCCSLHIQSSNLDPLKNSEQINTATTSSPLSWWGPFKQAVQKKIDDFVWKPLSKFLKNLQTQKYKGTRQPLNSFPEKRAAMPKPLLLEASKEPLSLPPLKEERSAEEKKEKIASLDKEIEDINNQIMLKIDELAQIQVEIDLIKEDKNVNNTAQALYSEYNQTKDKIKNELANFRNNLVKLTMDLGIEKGSSISQDRNHIGQVITQSVNRSYKNIFRTKEKERKREIELSAQKEQAKIIQEEQFQQQIPLLNKMGRKKSMEEVLPTKTLSFTSSTILDIPITKSIVARSAPDISLAKTITALSWKDYFKRNTEGYRITKPLLDSISSTIETFDHRDSIFVQKNILFNALLNMIQSIYLDKNEFLTEEEKKELQLQMDNIRNKIEQNIETGSSVLPRQNISSKNNTQLSTELKQSSVKITQILKELWSSKNIQKQIMWTSIFNIINTLDTFNELLENLINQSNPVYYHTYYGALEKVMNTVVKYKKNFSNVLKNNPSNTLALQYDPILGLLLTYFAYIAQNIANILHNKNYIPGKPINFIRRAQIANERF